MRRLSSRKTPSTIFVVNGGSSSLKVASWRGGRRLLAMSIDRIGQAGTWRSEISGRIQTRSVRTTNLGQALQLVLTALRRLRFKPDVIAHRVVHGGGVFHQPTRLTPAVAKKLRHWIDLAPLHMKPNLQAIAVTRRTWPKIPEWAVFDTSLFDELPPAARAYAIPTALSRRYHIRKYGFHGISHEWAWRQACRQAGRAPGKTSGVTIHLGAGDSVTAWRAGRPVDTSMGFTPLEGLTMATRSGDIDPMIPLYLQEHAGLSAPQVADILMQRSGLVGLTGLRDVRDVLSAAGHRLPGWPRRGWTTSQRHHASLALDMFLYDVQRYLASYLGLLSRPNLIVFTGSVGQNPWIRRHILRGVPAARGIPVRVIPADEERAIAEAVSRMVQ